MQGSHTSNFVSTRSWNSWFLCTIIIHLNSFQFRCYFSIVSGKLGKKSRGFRTRSRSNALGSHCMSWQINNSCSNWPGPEMFKMSTFSLVFIKSDHGVLSIYLCLVALSFGLHRPHVSSKIASQELLGRVHLQSAGTDLPRLAMPKYVHLS